MILIELGVNSSIEEYATPLARRVLDRSLRLDAAQAGEHQSAPIFVTQRTK
jgi:hypothetical protein